MEKNCESYPQDTVDAKTGDTTRRDTMPTTRAQEEERRHGRRTSCGDEEDELDAIEERVRSECRRTCRRRLLVELFKTITKVAGVILAAMGLSSFNAED